MKEITKEIRQKVLSLRSEDLQDGISALLTQCFVADLEADFKVLWPLFRAADKTS